MKRWGEDHLRLFRRAEVNKKERRAEVTKTLEIREWRGGSW